MERPSSYACQQLREAAYSLASRGSLEDRLARVAVNRLVHVREDEIPTELRFQWGEIERRLRAEERFDISVKAMSEDQRERVARDVLTLYVECEVALRAEGGG